MYHEIYKCRLCGSFFEENMATGYVKGDDGFEEREAHEAIEDFCERCDNVELYYDGWYSSSKYKREAGQAGEHCFVYIERHIKHICGDGSIGVADFVGMRKGCETDDYC